MFSHLPKCPPSAVSLQNKLRLDPFSNPLHKLWNLLSQHILTIYLDTFSLSKWKHKYSMKEYSKESFTTAYQGLSSEALSIPAVRLVVLLPLLASLAWCLLLDLSLIAPPQKSKEIKAQSNKLIVIFQLSAASKTKFISRAKSVVQIRNCDTLLLALQKLLWINHCTRKLENITIYDNLLTFGSFQNLKSSSTS